MNQKKRLNVSWGAKYLAVLCSLGWQIANADICTVPGQYSSIQAALDRTECDEIDISAGTFFENLTISRNVYLHGAGMEQTAIDGDSKDRVINISEGLVVTMSNLTVKNGRSRYGSGIYNEGATTLNHVAVMDNIAFGPDGSDGAQARSGSSGRTAYGGGIYNEASLTMNHSVVKNNEVQGGNGGNGGDAADNNTTAGTGSRGRDSDCPFIGACPDGGNGGRGSAGGAGDDGASGGRGGSAQGGGIYHEGTNLVLSYSTVQSNRVVSGNGGLGGKGGKGGTGGTGGRGGSGDTAALRACGPAGNGGRGGTGGTGGDGGKGGEGGLAAGAGIYTSADTMSMSNTIVSDNQATSGQWGGRGEAGQGGSGGAGGAGGSANGCRSGSPGSRGSTGRTGTTYQSCEADPECTVAKSEGGGLYIRNQIQIARSTFSTNVANRGGAVRVFRGELTLSNSTLSDNTATEAGGGLYSSRPVQIVNGTLVDNSAPEGAGIWQENNTLTLANSILANRINGNQTNCFSSDNSISTQGHNIATDDSCQLNANSDKPNTDPKLGPLSLNGSITPSHALQADSPAIDAGNNSTCAASPVSGQDQRGVGRPQPSADSSARCDIGAVEYIAGGIAGNHGFSGLWWEPARSGQGINLWQRGNTVFGAWYIYDANGQDLWVTFSGNLNGGSLTGPLTLNKGPAIGKPWDVSQVRNESVGTMTLVFTSDTQATFTYTLLGNSGSLNLEPFILDPAQAEDGAYAGFWWNPATSGQGLNLWHKGDQLFGVWFLYDEVGTAQWVTFNGTQNGSSMPQTDLIRHTGPALGTSWDTSQLATQSVGNVSIEFGNDTAQFNYTLNGVSGSLQLIPFYP